MEITLDQESWEVSEGVPLMEVLADLGGKARAQHRIVASLTVGGQSLTDRDLVPALLAKTIATVGPVRATTRSLSETLLSGHTLARRFASELHASGSELLTQLRGAAMGFGALDRWLGGLADYVEFIEHMRTHVTDRPKPESLITWVEALLEARRQDDIVRLADLLEYELLPRLSGGPA